MDIRDHKPDHFVFSTLHPKNMTCSCCMQIITQLMEAAGAKIKEIQLGKIDFLYDPMLHNKAFYIDLLTANGFEPAITRDDQLVDRIKSAVIELIHKAGNVNSIIRNSDYLVERIGLSYTYLSALFSKVEHITLEKYIILHKIEKAKELIDYDELTLSEIAIQLGYSSVHYLSNQFRQVTGVSVTEYRKSDLKRIPLDLIGKIEQRNSGAIE
ncbi:MAG: AraC family transcriptional [Bacteroidetes bacterium]|nr:MAG: AraC family transcriptional [Bacteroidota bacterium]